MRYHCLKKMILLLTILLVLSLPVQAEQPFITVALWTEQQSVSLVPLADAKLINEQRTASILLKKGSKILLTFKNKQFVCQQGTLPGNRVFLVPVAQSEPLRVEVNHKTYVGSFDFVQEGKGFSVLNELPMEEYVYGIVTKEVSPSWGAEVLKAQAVAARTFAIYNSQKKVNKTYDVCATVKSQVYEGVGKEFSAVRQAVKETQGEILTYHGQPINAVYHSSSGGYTEDCKNVWGTELPYLHGVPDMDQNSPHYKWTTFFTPAEFSAELEKAGYHLGVLRQIMLSELKKPPMAVADRGVSGRVKKLVVTGEKGRIELSGANFRSLLGLKSTLFDIHLQVKSPNDILVPIGADGEGSKKIDVKLNPYQEKNTKMDPPGLHRITGRPGEQIVIVGYGWGHGVGMSQWGAKAMAETAGAKKNYQAILKYYYQGVDIKKVY